MAQIRSQAQYRTSFIVDISGQFVFAILDIVVILVLFRSTPALGGFELVDVLLITTLANFGNSIADLAVGNVERLKFYVRTGLLDAMLIRPRRVLLQLLAIDFASRRVGKVVFGGAAVATVVTLIDVDWTWWRVALLVFTPLCSAIYFSAVFVASSSVAFWWIDSGEFANSVTYGGREFAQYPITIFQGTFRHIFAFGLGLGFVSYYPTLAILGKPDPLGMPAWFACGGIVAAGTACLAAWALWTIGIRHYKGAGS